MSGLMSDGQLFRAVVRGLMKDAYLHSDEFADCLRPAYEGLKGRDAVRSIAVVYDALPQQERDVFRNKFLRIDHLRRRFTREGVDEIARYYLMGVDEENLNIIQRFIATLVEHLLLFKGAKTFHFGGMGVPGVGKSSALSAIIQLIVFGKVGGGRNKALARLIESQKQSLDKLPEAIREMLERPETKNSIYLTPGTMTGAGLQKGVKEQKPDVDLESDGADLEQVVCGIFIDEADLIGSVKPKSKKDDLVAKLADLAEGNLVDAKFHKGEVSSHHIKIIGWYANITPLNPQADPLQQRQSVAGQLKDQLSGKFTPERLPSAMNTIILK